MNFLAKCAVVLQLLASIAASIFLIAFFGYLVAAGTAYVVDSVRSYGKRKIKAVA